MKRFLLQRYEDVTGASGVGIVAEGVEFTDSTVAVRWRSDNPSTVLWPNIDSAMQVHSHDGKTELAWIDY